jgi:hypothetical protein
LAAQLRDEMNKFLGNSWFNIIVLLQKSPFLRAFLFIKTLEDFMRLNQENMRVKWVILIIIITTTTIIEAINLIHCLICHL